MTQQDFLRAFETTLELEPGTIAGHESLSELEWWDSLAALAFMSVADQELEANISGDQLKNCKTIPDLLALVSDKLKG
jgi:acyl carrier protein